MARVQNLNDGVCSKSAHLPAAFFESHGPTGMLPPPRPRPGGGPSHHENSRDDPPAIRTSLNLPRIGARKAAIGAHGATAALRAQHQPAESLTRNRNVAAFGIYLAVHKNTGRHPRRVCDQCDLAGCPAVISRFLWRSALRVATQSPDRSAWHTMWPSSAQAIAIPIIAASLRSPRSAEPCPAPARRAHPRAVTCASRPLPTRCRSARPLHNVT